MDENGRYSGIRRTGCLGPSTAMIQEYLDRVYRERDFELAEFLGLYTDFLHIRKKESND